MSDTSPTPPERDLDNLRAVARHLGRGAGTPSREEGAGAGGGERPGRTGRWKVLAPLGVAVVFLIGKGKFLLAFLKFAKMGTLLTMLLAVWLYAQIWGFAFALGFVLLIFVHEMGHAVAMRRVGLKAGAPVFIPFVGAVIAMKEMPRDAYIEAVVALGGPALGTVGAIVCLGVGVATGSLFWYALASTGFLINLFNMIPISPLDGGRIVGVIGRWLWGVGYAVGIVVLLMTKSPILFLILILGLFGLARTLRGPRPGYYEVPKEKRQLIGLAYFGLLIVMVLGMFASEQPLAGLGT